MKKSGFLKELFADVKVKISAGIIAVVLLILGITAIVNPSLLKGLFGYSGEGLMGDYVVNTGQKIDVYKHLENLRTAESQKAQGLPPTVTADRTMDHPELFGLDAIQEVEGVQYAAILFYDANDTAWRGYITKAQLDTMTTKNTSNDYVVLFVDSDGKELARQALNTGEKATYINAAKEGFVLEGWYNGTTKFNFNNLVTSDLILKAKWNPDIITTKYTVTFNLMGGVMPGGATTIPAQQVNTGAKAVAPSAYPTKTGYAFKGWANANAIICAAIGCEPPLWNFDTPITANLNLNAVWHPVVDSDPTLSLTTNASNPITGWSNKDVTVTAYGKAGRGDTLSTTPYSWNNGTYTSDNTKVFTATTDVNVKVRTLAGRTASRTVSVKIDKVEPSRPTYSLKTADGQNYNGTWTNQVVTLNNVIAVDGGTSGIDHYEYSGTCTTAGPWYLLGAQHVYNPAVQTYDYAYCVRAVDKAGNAGDMTSRIIIKVTNDLAKPAVTVSGNPTKWVNDDVKLTVNVSNQSQVPLAAAPYSFDGGNNFQATNYKVYKSNATATVVVKASTGALSVAQTVPVKYIDKTDPVVSVTKNSSTASGGNGVNAIYWVRVKVDDSQSKIYVTGSYRYSNSDWNPLKGLYSKIWANSKGSSAVSGLDYYDIYESGNKWRESIDGYYKLQGFDGSTKSRAYISVRDEAGNTHVGNYPSGTTWFSK